MSHRRVNLAAAALIAFLLGCGGGCSKSSGSGQHAGGMPNEDLPRDLKPLPEAPPLQVPPEGLPGANGELAVVTSRPRGDFRGEVRPTITFSKPVKSLAMVETQVAADKERPFAKIEPALEGEWKWLGSASVEFVPKGLVPYSTPFKVTVPKGLKAIDGTELKEDFSYEFNTPRLEVQDVSPVKSYQWIKPDETFRIVFNQPVKNEDLTAALSFRVAGDANPRKVKVLSKVSIAEERRKAEEQAKKEGRAYDRQSFEDRGFKNQQTRYEISAEKPFPKDTKVTLHIAETLHGEQGPLTIAGPEDLEWSVYGPLRLTSAKMCAGEPSRCPLGPLVVFTTNKVDVESLKGKVHITPAVEVDWARVESWSPHEYYGNNNVPYFSLPAKYKPGKKYSVKIDPGVADEFKQVFASPFDGQGQTDDFEPQLRTGGSLAVVEASAGPKLPIELVNLKSLDVKLWKLTLPEAAVALAKPYYSDKLPVRRAPDTAERQSIKYAWNQARVHGVDLTKALPDGKTGLVLTSLNSPELDHPSKNGFVGVVEVTDLAAHIKIAPKKSLAWVTRMSDGAPVSGADVSVYDANGKVVWTGITNEDGLADIPGVADLKIKDAESRWERPYLMVAASKDGDTSVTASSWSSGVEAYEFGLSEGWEGKTPESSGYIFTDRGIYRPGDKVYIKGLARYRQVGQLKAPERGSKLTVTVTNSRDEKVSNTSATVTPYGTFNSEVEIPKDAPTGYFSIEVLGAAPGGPLHFSSNFRVEEYRAPQFKVDVQPEKQSLVAGAPLNAQVFARYLFGGAMSNAKVKWSAHSETSSFSPDTGTGFTFGQETWWWDDNTPKPTGGFFASGEGTVDAKGAFTAAAGNVEAPAEKTWSYTLEAEVEDVNRQAVAGRASVIVHPAEYYVGLRAPTGFPEVNKDFQLDAMVTDTTGKRVAGRKFEVTLSSRGWKSVRQKDASGGFTTISEPVEEKVNTCSLKSEETPVPCKYKPTAPGFYIARATIEDDQHRKHTASLGVYVIGSGWVAWQRNDTDRIELVPDKTLYNVGDVAKVLVKSPYPEARALMTVEREGVLERRPMMLKGSVVTVEIPITEEMVPNVFAGILLMHPRVNDGGLESGDDPGRPSARVGLVKLNVERKTKRLSVAVKSDKTDYQPGQEVSVSLEVKDSAGKPTQTELTVFVVDEAVLRLTDYKTPDPIASIFPDRPLSVRLGEPLLHLVRRRNYGEKGEDPGGGGGGKEGAGYRNNFKTTALFSPTVETKADGTAQVKFKLPDNLTTFRVMAVAVSMDDRFGSGETAFKVNKPLLLLPAMPRFARVGDKFEAGVVVHAYGAAGGDVTVTAMADGARLLGPGEQKVPVTETTPREVRFQFTADKSGTATFRFKAVRGADQDGVEQKIPVELPVTLEAVATYGDTTDQRVEGIAPPSGVWPGLGGLDVTMASTSMGNFEEGMHQLVEYPYGCLEQQSSRLVPFVALREIAGKFGVPWPTADQKKLAQLHEENNFFRQYLFDPLDVTEVKDPDVVIGTTVKSIQKLQNPDGSFRYWAEDRCPSSWASAYATLALGRANQAGFEVNLEELNRAEGFVAQVAGGKCAPCELWCPLETRVFASYVLARLGQPKASLYGEFFSKREELPLFSKALLADAMFVGGGDRKQANILMTDILNHAKESAKGVHFEEVQSKTYATLWHSDTRTTGAVLETLTDISPEHPYVSKIVHYLTGIRQGNGQWRSTQEAAFSLMALSEVLKTKEKDTPNFKAGLSMGGKPLMEETFQGRSMAVKSKHIGIDALVSAAGGQEQKLAFKKDGTGVLYYSALLRYAPKELPMKPLDRGLFVQRWFEPFNGGGQTTKFYAGDLVRIRVRVATNQERHWTVFEVPLPAGLEPVDTSLATTASQGMTPHEESRGAETEYESGEDQESGSAYESESGKVNEWAYSFWSPFNHIEQRDSRVMLFADHLPPGVHVTSFVARATTPGTFLLKPASGALMYEPEVFGRSEGGTFEVVLPAQVSAR